MPTLRELKTRIGTVKSTEKMTGAMKMISSAKVHQHEQRLKQLQPYRQKLTQIMGHILGADQDFQSPLIERREVRVAAFVVFGSDNGLCGAYNMNVFKGLLQHLDECRRNYPGVHIKVYPVGEKIAKAVSQLEDVEVIVPQGVIANMSAEQVQKFTDSLRSQFIGGETDMVEVLYMKFKNIARQTLTLDPLFPVNADKLTDGTAEPKDENQLYIFEPDANSIFNEVLPMFVLSTMQEITIENQASEQAARMIAMQTANDNAQELLGQLQLEYNKLRQQSITAELLDLLGGQVER